jgi:hypothetical protein
MSLLVKARARCVCNQVYSCDLMLEDVEVTASGGIALRHTRETALLRVAKAVLEHSANHERVAMMLTLNMEEAADV